MPSTASASVMLCAIVNAVMILSERPEPAAAQEQPQRGTAGGPSRSGCARRRADEAPGVAGRGRAARDPGPSRTSAENATGWSAARRIDPSPACDSRRRARRRGRRGSGGSPISGAHVYSPPVGDALDGRRASDDRSCPARSAARQRSASPCHGPRRRGAGRGRVRVQRGRGGASSTTAAGRRGPERERVARSVAPSSTIGVAVAAAGVGDRGAHRGHRQERESDRSARAALMGARGPRPRSARRPSPARAPGLSIWYSGIVTTTGAPTRHQRIGSPCPARAGRRPLHGGCDWPGR